jgi:hypothetical protein
MNDDIKKEEDGISPYVQAYFRAPVRRLAPKMQRNEHCQINNKKFKKCCGADGSNFCKKLLGDYLNELQKAQEQLSKNDQSS